VRHRRFACIVHGWLGPGRYLVDVAPLLTLEGIVLIAISWQAVREPRVQHLFSWGVGGAAAYGVLVNTAFAAAGLRTILKLSLR